MASRINKHKECNVVYAVVIEGESEQHYINSFKRYYNKNISIKCSLCKNSIKLQYKRVMEFCTQNYNHVFWIIDFDTIVKENCDAKEKNKAIKNFKLMYQKIANDNARRGEKITIIVNNPCLEYWYYLHKNQDSTKYYATYNELFKDLKKFRIDAKLFEKYEKKQNVNLFDKLLPYLKKMDFSKLNKFDIADCQNKSVSEMYKLWQFFEIDNKE